MDIHSFGPSDLVLNKLCDALVECGWAEVPNFINAGIARALKEDAELKFQSGQFREARIGRAQDLKTEKRIRSDLISWFEPTELSSVQADLWQKFERLRVGFNEKLFLGLHDLEAHYARYQPGSSYGKHVDRFNSDDARTVSIVLYLNENWLDQDGGVLKLYPKDKAEVSIKPDAGTLACFMSAELEHEVIPSPNRTRLSVAGWFRKQKSPLG